MTDSEKIDFIYNFYLKLDEENDYDALVRFTCMVLGSLISGSMQCPDKNCNFCQKVRNIEVEATKVIPDRYLKEIREARRYVESIDVGVQKVEQ